MSHHSDLPSDLGQTLSKLRNDAGLKQSDISRSLAVDPSRVSRIETGDFSPTREEIEAYLKAVGTNDALRYIDFLEQDWRLLLRPSFWHPDQEDLWCAEHILQRLEAFRSKPDVPTPLLGQTDMYYNTVWNAAQYLAQTTHTIAYIGDIGVGKTTFVCTQSGLVLSEADKSGLLQTVLEVGGGGITVCEVRIRQGATYGIIVDPLEDSEIYKLVGEFCAGLVYDSSRETSDEIQEMGVAREIDRAIRNMAGLTRTRRKDADGKPIKIDPARELADQFGKDRLDEFRAEVSERLKLWKRLRREVWSTAPTDAESLHWLKQIFAAINNGRHPEFSLPKRMHIIVPYQFLPMSQYDLEIVDTKGVDKVAIRPDLQSFADDPRAVTVLCSNFKSAPDVSLQGYIEHLTSIGTERALDERVMLLVLPKSAEALAMKDDAGEVAESEEEAYDFKRDQVEATLRKFGFGNIPIHFSNVMSDDPNTFSQAVIAQIGVIRSKQAKRISNIESAVEQLIENQEQEYALAAQRAVNKSLRIFIEQYNRLPDRRRRVQDTLMNAVTDIHQRTLWASVRRSGSWDNFDVYYYLGSGGAADARLRTNTIFQEVEGLVKNKLGDHDLAPAHSFLKELSVNIILWRESFLEAVRRSGELTFRPALEDDDAFWSLCEGIYGQGRAFRREVKEKLQDWFESDEHHHLHTAFEERVQRAWHQEFLKPFEKICSQTGEEDGLESVVADAV